MKNPKTLGMWGTLVLASATPAGASWTLIDNFETGFTTGQTINGLNGWVADVPLKTLAVADPAASGRGMVARVQRDPARNDVYKALGAAGQIGSAATATLFFEAYFTGGGVSNTSVGVSDAAAPNDFAAFKPQFRFLGPDLFPRNGGVFTDTGYNYDAGKWVKVWVVLNNATDSADMYVKSPSGSFDRVQIADNYGFRTTSGNALVAFLLVQNGGADVQDGLFDNVYVDPSGENLTDPTIVDTDTDSMDDNWEITNFGDKTRDGTLDFDADGLLDLAEYNRGTEPDDKDTDDDGAEDGPETTGASNAFNGAATNPLDSDSDDDGARDGQENGSLNTQFANAPTNPNAADTDGDGMSDGYELTCNTPGTALNPRDNGSTDTTQLPASDRDGDNLTNIIEFTSVVRTRADLKDSDGDGYWDNVEDNGHIWGGVTMTGTSPIDADSDDDGIPDGGENPDLTPFPGPGVYPTNSDPNLADSDLDQFPDKYEVDHGTDPVDPDVKPTQATGFTLVENFEGGGMTVGQTIHGVNGWTASQPTLDLVADEPIEGGDKVLVLPHVSTLVYNTAHKSLDLDLQILEGNTGTLFMQVYLSSMDANVSLGLSDQTAPVVGDFGAYEAQLTPFRGGITRVRDSAVFRDVSNYRTGEWANVWIVADNANDVVKVYWESPVGQTGVIEITNDGGVDPFGFRNGTVDTLKKVLLTFATDSVAGTHAYIDNIYIDPAAVNLTKPVPDKPVLVVAPMITSVSFNGGGDLVITFTPGGPGFILKSSNDLTAPFVAETNALYDNLGTFTVPAAFLNPGRDFFRVEKP